MNMSKKLLIAAVIAVLAAAALYLLSNRILIYVISKIYGMELKCGSIEGSPFSEMRITDLTAFNKNAGFGISATDARIINKSGLNIFDNVGLEMDVKDLYFIKGPSKENYNDIPNLMMVPFNSKWKYSMISTKVRLFKEKITISAFNAVGDDIKLDFNGDLFYDNRISGNMKIYFSQTLLKKIPEPLADEALSGEADGWKSLQLNISGDYKSPSINISSKLFRMNVKSVVTAE